MIKKIKKIRKNQSDKKLKESYCLLIGLNHDLTTMDSLPYDEKAYIKSRLLAIEERLLSGMGE